MIRIAIFQAKKTGHKRMRRCTLYNPKKPNENNSYISYKAEAFFYRLLVVNFSFLYLLSINYYVQFPKKNNLKQLFYVKRYNSISI